MVNDELTPRWCGGAVVHRLDAGQSHETESSRYDECRLRRARPTGYWDRIDGMGSELLRLCRARERVFWFDGSMMKRRDDSQRSGRLAVTVGDLRVVDRVVASIVSLPRLGFDGSMMKRRDDSQRSGRLAVTVGDLRVVDRVVASIVSLPRLGFDGSMMKRRDDSQRSDRLAVTQPVHPPPH